jgi:hypothetical protein
MKSKRTSKLSILVLIAGFLSIIPIQNAIAAACAPTQTYSGNYIYLAFTSSSQSTTAICDWKIPNGISQIDLFMVGGGGAGGNRHAGGGGAGGLYETNSVSVLNIDTLTITIGKGGVGQGDISGNPGTGPNGDTTTITKGSGSGSFNTLNAIGGGGGISGGGAKAASGGSGGGAYDINTGCSGTVCYGLGLQQSSATGGSGNNGAGGNGGAGSIWSAGGGGGALTAGSAGASGSTGVAGGGAGGSGDFWNSDFSTTIAASLGLDTSTSRVSGGNLYFAAGGGGGSTANSTRSLGGLGGGGNGGANDGTLATASAVSAISNTGSGGGGTGIYGGNSGVAGSGAAGIVLIRFLRNSTATVSLASGNLIYRTTKNITATSSSAGKIDFLANNKTIPGCRGVKVSSPSFTAICAYRPSVKAPVTITARFTPTDPAYFSASVISSTYFVIPRAGSR